MNVRCCRLNVAWPTLYIRCKAQLSKKQLLFLQEVETTTLLGDFFMLLLAESKLFCDFFLFFFVNVVTFFIDFYI